MGIKKEDDEELFEDEIDDNESGSTNADKSIEEDICDDYEEGYEDDYEYNDEEEYDDGDDNGRKVKIIVASIIVAAIIAAVGIFVYNKIKSDNNQQEVNTEVQSDVEQEETSADTAENEENVDDMGTDNQEQEVNHTELDSNEESFDNGTIEGEPVLPEEDSSMDSGVEENEESNLPIPTSTPKPLPTETPVIEENIDEENGAISSPSIETGITEPADVIFIGDTRFRNMANIADSNADLWECSSSGNYEWLTSTAYPDVEPRVGEGTDVFINIGINDLTRYQSYAISINEKAAEWKEKGANVYFVAIGPVAQSSSTSNQEITEFNTYMYNNLDIPFIDAYNHLIETGFSTNELSDGVEYTDETSIVLYDYLNELIGR